MRIVEKKEKYLQPSEYPHNKGFQLKEKNQLTVVLIQMQARKMMLLKGEDILII